jgi:hypothetical protein
MRGGENMTTRLLRRTAAGMMNGIVCGAVLCASVTAGVRSAGAGAPQDAGRALPAPHTIGCLALSSHRTQEDSAALRWLETETRFAGRALDMDRGLPDLAGIDVLWIHIDDSADYARWAPHVPELKPLKSWYEKGGRFLFTGLAAMIPHEAGIEPVAPAIEATDIEDDWLFDQKGFQGFRPAIDSDGGAHPVFNGLFGGTFTWDADSNNRAWCAGYFGAGYPAVGKVVAVEKSYITISAERKLVIEFDNGRGRGLAVGGFIFFGKRNNRRANMEKFLENALAYVAGEPMPGTARYWTRSDLNPRRVGFPPTLMTALRHGGIRARNISSRPWTDASPGPLIRRDSATENFYDVAGPQALIMGKEKGGIDEVWVHPFRLLRDYRTGIVSGDTIAWLDGLSPVIEIRPESFTRLYTTSSGTVKEIVFAAQDKPAGIVRYEYSGTGRIRLALKFRSDLRLMWPYDWPATGSLSYSSDTATGTFLVSDETGGMWGAVGADAVPAVSIAGTFDSVWWSDGGFHGRPTRADQVYRAALYDLGAGENQSITLAMAGSGGDTAAGGDGVVASILGVLSDPAAAYEQAVGHYRELLAGSVTIESPDSEFNDLFKWALVGADRFFARTPGVGSGLLAGYSTTARGWDGGQKISGRPGYAWYFGRDAEWSGFAIDDYGDFPLVRRELEFLQKYQDLSGKIFHEISTSGSVHYDAADATPLYVILAAHYLRASGDTAFIRESWPHILKAMDYLYSTDTDGDGLIENTNQGHGWVEGGKLYPVHTEFYLAGAWGKALFDAAYMASNLGWEDLAENFRLGGDAVRVALNRDFWNDSTRFFNYGKLADGRYNPEPTALPATVMYFGLLDDAKVKPVLEQYAGEGFSSDWGVRIVSSSSPLFNPQGYHYGSIWPLFTGWTALAEYEYGNSTQGFTHILNNLYIKNHWALGFVEEVMNGAVYKPSGVCPHQCWSETNILHPAITGMIGWKPDAPSHSAALYPRFPAHWDSVKVTNLRIGGSKVDFTMARSAKRTVYTMKGDPHDPVTIEFAPEIPAGMKITHLTVGGREIKWLDGRRRGLLDPPVDVDLRGDAEIVLEHTGGIAVVPMMPRPEPGDSSTGARIISATMRDGIYEIVLEGNSGSTSPLKIRSVGGKIPTVENATLRDDPGKGLYLLDVAFPSGQPGYVRTTVRVTP